MLPLLVAVALALPILHRLHPAKPTPIVAAAPPLPPAPALPVVKVPVLQAPVVKIAEPDCQELEQTGD